MEQHCKRLKKWLAQKDTREEIAYLIISYDSGWGDKTARFIMSELEFLPLTQTLDDVGWCNLMEGKIPREIIRLQEEHYRHHNIQKR